MRMYRIYWIFLYLKTTMSKAFKVGSASEISICLDALKAFASLISLEGELNKLVQKARI